jgi:hypothetical protein
MATQANNGERVALVQGTLDLLILETDSGLKAEEAWHVQTQAK